MLRLRPITTATFMVLLACYLLVPAVGAPFAKVAYAPAHPFAQPFGNNVSNTIPSDCSASSSSETEVTTASSTTATATVPGNVPSPVRTNTIPEIGTMPASSTLHMELVFKIRNQDQFTKCLATISDPSSPDYRHFLNATTLAPFIETSTQKETVREYLEAHGLTVTDGPSLLVLDIMGPTSVVQQVFQLHVKLYQPEVGHIFYSADTDPTLPQPLASGIEDLTGLENYTTVKPATTPTTCSGPYCPQGVEFGYSMAGLYSSGFKGSGVTVAVVDGPGDPNPCCNATSALHQYDLQYSLQDPTFQVQCGGGTTWGPCSSLSYDPGWASEAAMDIEAVHAMAPGAAIDLFYATTYTPPTYDPFIDAIDYVAANHLAQVVSNSWTYGPSSDLELGASFVSGIDSRFALDAAQGLTIIFATGDQGARPNGSTLGVEYPSSDPNVLAVGATDLTLTGCGTHTCSGYGSEEGASISGGGYSGVFAEPAWQTATINPTSAQCPTGHLNPTCRAVPDVSMLGYIPGIWVYSSYASACGGGSGGGWFSCFGTSLSTPLWAGFLATAVQLNRGVGFGNIDPLIYKVASSGRYASDFHDITSGSNNGYSAVPGWDPVTGWGTPVGSNLAFDLGPPRFTVTSSGGIIVNQGSSGSSQVTVTLSGGPTVPITLACTSGLPQRASCFFNPSSSNPNYTSTLTLSTEPSTPAGSFEVVVNGAAGSTSNSTTFTLTVNQHQQSCTQTSLPSVYNCPLAFVQGWNLISLLVVPVVNSTFPNTVVGIFGSNATFGFMSNVTDVFTYTSGGWQSCIVTKQGSGVNTKYNCVGTLMDMVDGKGYWVYAKAAFTLNNANKMAPSWGGLVGSIIPPLSPPPSYALTAGWNLVGYKPQPYVTAIENVTTYLQSLNGHYELANVWIYDNSNQAWVRATADTQLKPSEAMWIFMTTPATLRP